jgi:hypothetical protein
MMNLYKVKMNYLLMILFLMFSLNVFAEEAPYLVFEAFHLQIKLSKDGSGIVKGIECQSCDYKFVKITPDSKATVNGVEVDIREARRRAGKMAMVSFNPRTREVQYIRWSE